MCLRYSVGLKYSCCKNVEIKVVILFSLLILLGYTYIEVCSRMLYVNIDGNEYLRMKVTCSD